MVALEEHKQELAALASALAAGLCAGETMPYVATDPAPMLNLLAALLGVRPIAEAASRTADHAPYPREELLAAQVPPGDPRWLHLAADLPFVRQALRGATVWILRMP